MPVPGVSKKEAKTRLRGAKIQDYTNDMCRIIHQVMRCDRYEFQQLFDIQIIDLSNFVDSQLSIMHEKRPGENVVSEGFEFKRMT